MADKIRTADVRAALRRRYPAPEYATLFEVGDATGARHTRFADAMVMGLWPSRGLELWGMEIKISRKDWAKERAQPQKAETIAAYCDRWWLVTAPNVVRDEAEIPLAWGWLEFNGRAFVRRRDAQKTETAPIDRKFLAALLRRSDEATAAMVEARVAERTKDVQERAAKQLEDNAAVIETEVQNRTRAYQKLKEEVDAFEKAAGFRISQGYGWGGSGDEMGRLVGAIRTLGIDNAYGGLATTAKRLADFAHGINKQLAALGLPPRAEKDDSANA
ncbi:hypothetical protein BA190_09615 [Labrys sp. WJW]|uniref:hypothetical protein n=1 Tax=Labrys sp. WJW TaxID=1737983 RepID=UPI00083063AB|nr:hypothetical protein [Labrys sp. WJW]OCC05162.1 hypothetical protein BA190_09615 [Labrys sp. WJW]